MNSTVYVNGHRLGTRPYGYISFSYDLTPWLHAGRNVIAVHVDNAEQPNSRWYSGCGIYRNVWIRSLGDIHIPLWGQHVQTDVTDSSATIRLTTDLTSKAKKTTSVSVSTVLIDAAGRTVEKSSPVTVTLSASAPTLK